MHPLPDTLTNRSVYPITLGRLRNSLLYYPHWFHIYPVIDLIEKTMCCNETYHNKVQLWLTYREFSTVWLRDEIMEPLRYHPTLVEIGKRFNPTTEWHNTWMPLDTLIHNLMEDNNE